MVTLKKLISLDDTLALRHTQKEVIESALDFYFDHTDSVMTDSKDVYKELGIDI